VVLRRYVLAAALFTLVAASCGGGASAAATVNGVDFDRESVVSMVTSDAPIDDDQFRQVLVAVIQWTAITDAAREEYGIDPTDEEIAEYADNVVAQTGVTRGEYLETQQVSEEGFLLYAEQLIIGEQMIEIFEAEVDPPTEAEAQQLLADDPAAWTVVCASHILVDTQDEATSVLSRLDEGEDFAELAVELSLDTGSGTNGGDLGCTVPTEYVAEFADASMNAEIGVVTDPVETEFGFHLIRVDSRTEATTEELSNVIVDDEVSNLMSSWYLAAVTDAEITVNSDYGTWSTDPVPTIVAPAS
jgi:parvulin-like peptidyl-prolyl isomerase